MAYARKGPDSDIWLYQGEDRWYCVDCPLTTDFDMVPVDTAADVLAHMKAHIAAGHRVPAKGLAEIQEEL